MELLNHKTTSFYVSCLPSKPSRLIRESLQLSKGHNHPNHVYYRLHLFAFSIFMSRQYLISSFHPSVLVTLLNFHWQKRSISNSVAFKPIIFVGQHWEFKWPTQTHYKICGEIFRPCAKFLITWIAIEMTVFCFPCENSLNNGKCDCTFRERPLRGHGFS